ASQIAMEQSTASTAYSSNSCINGEIRSPFSTEKGFRCFEILLTEIQETYSPSKIETRRRGPIFALDLSDDEVVRVLMADCEPERFGELKAILDTIRVWTRARRPTPRVVGMDPFFRGAPQALALRVTTDDQYRASRWPPGQVTSWLLTDPRG